MPQSELIPTNVLLVDDRPENLVALKAILERPEYRLVTATSGQEALSLVIREQVSIILLDVAMPEMDGFEVAVHLKQLERTRDIPILFVTAVATDVEHIYRAYSVGAVDYLIKPLDAEVVRKKVAVFAGLIRQREEIRRQGVLLREAERRDFERRLADLRLAGDRRYQKLVEGIDHVIGWSANGETFDLTFISRTGERILGYPIGTLAEPGFWRKYVAPEDQELVLSTFRRAISERTDQRCNYRMIAADGRVLWFHAGVAATSAEDAARAPELHGVSVDLTEIKRLEANQRFLAEASASLAGLFDHQAMLERLARLAVPYIADACVIDEVTESLSLRRVAAADGEAEKGLELCPDAATLGAGEEVAHALRTGESSLVVAPEAQTASAPVQERAEAPTVPRASSYMVLPFSARGRTLGIVTMVTAGTRRPFDSIDLVLAENLCGRSALAIDNARLYLEAKQAVAARDELMAIVSHDLRNLVSSILGAATLLQREAQAGKQAQRGMTILRVAERMDRFIGDLLEVTRMESGRMIVERHPVDSADMLSELVMIFGALAANNSQRLECVADEGLVVDCDRDRVLQALSNLVGNAIKFAPKGGTIEVRVQRKEREAVFSVADSGPGISPEELPHLFERFWQARTKSKMGVGLGLSIVKGVIEAHGGRIWVESAPGAGATFFFTLPLAGVAAEKAVA